MIEDLKDHLENGRIWSKLETDIDGVFVIKVPATKKRDPVLMIEINPTNKLTGKAKKKRGLFIADLEMYLQFRDALEEDDIAGLIRVIDEVNPELGLDGYVKMKKLKIRTN